MLYVWVIVSWLFGTGNIGSKSWNPFEFWFDFPGPLRFRNVLKGADFGQIQAWLPYIYSFSGRSWLHCHANERSFSGHYVVGRVRKRDGYHDLFSPKRCLCWLSAMVQSRGARLRSQQYKKWGKKKKPNVLSSCSAQILDPLLQDEPKFLKHNKGLSFSKKSWTLNKIFDALQNPCTFSERLLWRILPRVLTGWQFYVNTLTRAKSYANLSYANEKGLDFAWVNLTEFSAQPDKILAGIRACHLVLKVLGFLSVSKILVCVQLFTKKPEN